MKAEMLAKYAHLGRKLGLPGEIIIQIEKLGVPATPETPIMKEDGSVAVIAPAEGRITADDVDKLNLEQAKDLIRKLIKKLEQEKLKPETNGELEQARSLEDVLMQKDGIII